ncbi:MAG: peptidylprolyl isomerase [Kiritimatiellia bacterium]|jgi:peptidyl-prolyl cis-trans isomerase C
MCNNRNHRKHAHIWTLLVLVLCAGPVALSALAGDAEPAAATAEAPVAVKEPVAVPSEPVVTDATDAEKPAADPAEVIIVVNGHNITRADYTRETEGITGMMRSRGVPEAQAAAMLQSFKPQIIESLVSKSLLTQTCSEKGITVSDEELSGKIKAFEKTLPKHLTLDDLLRQSGLTREMFENDMREQLKLEKVLQINRASKEEVIAYYEENKTRFFEKPEMTQARHILIAVKPEDTDDQKKEKRERAEQLLKQIKEEKADFAELAKENSDCPSKAMGGDLGEFRRGQMVKEFEDAAFGMKVNEVSDIVETQFGYHIIQTLAHVEPKTLELDEVYERIVEALKGRAIQEKADVFMTEARKAAKITYAKGFEPEQTLDMEETKDAPEACCAGADTACQKDAPQPDAPSTDEPAEPAKTAEPPAAPAE